MGVSVILDLNEDVSAHDLSHFLSHIPEGFDRSYDLRMQIVEGVIPQFLEIRLPISPERD